MSFCQGERTYRQLIFRVFKDIEPPNGLADAVYIFGQTPDNETVAIRAGRLLYGAGKVECVTFGNIPETPELSSGPDIWIRRLCAPPGIFPEPPQRPKERFAEELYWLITGKRIGEKALIQKRDIRVIEPAKDIPLSTDAEALGFVRYAHQHGWGRVFIIATQIHQLRAFISTVSMAVKRERTNLQIYSYVPPAVSWTQKVRHSQSVPVAPRYEQLESEFEKIERYYDKGDYISGEEVLEYLNRRERPR